MVQNTTSSALVRLRPIQDANIGAIVEEHNRYHRKTKAKEEAEKRARDAKRQEFQRKINKQTFEIYNGLQPEENAGFLNSQIIDRFEENKEYYMNLAKASANGNIDARLKLADEKRKIESAVKINKVYTEKIQELEKQKRQGNFNELLDNDVDRFKESILQGKYKLNADYTLDVYSPALDDELKGTSTGLFKDGIVRLNSSTLFNNDFLNSSFNKKSNFIKNGQDIASNLLDNVNGNKRITAQTKSDGVKLVKGLLSQDSVEARSFLSKARKSGIFPSNKALGDLNEIEQNVLADRYYEEFVRPNLEEVDNSLNNSQKALNIRSGRRKEQAGLTTISASTNESGEILNELDVDAPFVPQQGDQVFNLAGKPLTVGVKGNSNTNKTFSSLIKTQDGRVFAVGKQTVKKDVLVRNDDGSIKTDSNGNDVTRVEEESVDIIETGEAILNNISRNIDKNKTSKLENLNELSILLDDKAIEQNRRVNNNPDRGILD